MAKYGGLTFGQVEALLNVLGGYDVLCDVLRGELALDVSAAGDHLLTTYDPSVGLRKLMELAVGEQNYQHISPIFTEDLFPLRSGIQSVCLKVMPLFKNESYDHAMERLGDVGHKNFPNPGDLAGFLRQHPHEVEKWQGVAAVSKDPNRNLFPFAVVDRKVRGFSAVGRYDALGYVCGILVFDKQQPKPVPVENTGLLTTYDSSVGLRKLMELAVGDRNLGNINLDIIQKRFPLREGIQKVNLEVVPRLNDESYEQTAERLKAAGHNNFPNTGDLAGYLREHPDEVEKWVWVAAVSEDSRWTNSNGDVYVPYARVHDANRRLGLVHFRESRGLERGILVFSKQQPRNP